MTVEVVMPQLGQAMVTGLVVAWHVADGEAVEAGAPLLTVESDKSAFELEASASGIVRHFASEGSEIDVGARLATIGANGEALAPSPAPVAAADRATATASTAALSATQGKVRASPRARALAEGRIALADIVPTGGDGMITAGDVERALAARAKDIPEDAPADRRKITAGHRTAIRRLQTSWNQAPHIVQMIEIDATRLAATQKAQRAGTLSATLNDVVIHAAARTMAEFPDLNVHVEGDEIVQHGQVDVSIAVATDRGLRTPVLVDIGDATLDAVAEANRAAIEASRRGRATAARASLTVSNLGRYGIRCGSPVLNLDETVLVFVGAIEERAVVVDGAVVARPGLTLSIAYDHRAVDGLRAAEFSAALRRKLETLDLPEATAPAPHPERAARLGSTAGLRCDLTNGRHRWVIDEPLAVGGQDSGPDPVTSVLAALLSCMTIAFRLVATRRKVPIERIAGAIEAAPDGKVKAITAVLEVWSGEPAARVEALLKPAKAACYVHDMLRPDLPLAIELRIHPLA
jgi:pyruvate/2-oxoglutarate dehydrogenase complex dihydrolipoamide acyltransferase (E2) component/uncharacterized OsmC-like protein